MKFLHVRILQSVTELVHVPNQTDHIAKVIYLSVLHAYFVYAKSQAVYFTFTFIFYLSTVNLQYSILFQRRIQLVYFQHSYTTSK